MTSKTQNKGEGSKNYRSFIMCLNLNDYKFKTSRYSYRSTYTNSMVTTNQKPQQIHKNQEQECKLTAKEKPSTHKGIKAEVNREELQKQPEKESQNGNKDIPTSNHFVCQWTEYLSNVLSQDG